MADLSGDMTGQPVAELLGTVRKEVHAGLYAETKAVHEECEANLDFYQCLNAKHLEKRPAEEPGDFQARPKQYSRITRRAIRTLAKLYNPGPSRTHENEAANAFIGEVYTSNHFDAMMHRADRMATLNGVAAIQVVASGEPRHPVRLDLWGRNEFVPYFTDDDYRKPAVLVTKTLVRRDGKKRTRCQIWTTRSVETWYSKEVDQGRPETMWGGTSVDQFSPAESGPNPYGVLPFAYVFNELPVTGFDGSGIGSPLREANQELDRMLSDQAQALQVFMTPRLFGVNLSSSFRWRDRIDGVTLLPKLDPDGAEPSVRPLQATLDVEQFWLHVERFANLTFEDLDIPIKAVRGEASWEESGIAIALKHTPMLEYLRARQREFAVYESDIASVVLTAIGTYLGIQDLKRAANEKLELQWAPPTLPIATSETDQGYQVGLNLGIESPITILMKRDGMTREQAISHLERVAEDNAVVARIAGGGHVAEPPMAGNQPGAAEKVEAEAPASGGDGDDQRQTGD